MAKVNWSFYEPPADAGLFGEWKILTPAEAERLRRALERRSAAAEAPQVSVGAPPPPERSDEALGRPDRAGDSP